MRSLSSANISTIAFWDIDPHQVDVERDSLLVMTKVFNYGTWSDIKAILKYYKLHRIRREIVQAAYLKKTALSFLCLLTGLDKSAFRVIQRREQRSNIIWQS